MKEPSMNLINATALSLILGSSMASAADCVNPDAPSIPDGASSTMDQMITGQKAVKSFQASNIEYMSCVETRISALETKVAETKGKEKEKEKEAIQKTLAESLDTYNQAVSAEESVAGAFNSAVRDYQAANPK
jgi:TolA-binding protein